MLCLQVELAKKLVETSFADKVFFCNSGTEANEGAIKFARKFARVSSGAEAQDAQATVPTEIVTFTNSFHGRTMGALALTAKTQYQVPFGPVMPGAVQVWPVLSIVVSPSETQEIVLNIRNFCVCLSMPAELSLFFVSHSLCTTTTETTGQPKLLGVRGVFVGYLGTTEKLEVLHFSAVLR